MHLTHAASPEGGEDFIGPDESSVRKGHVRFAQEGSYSV
jgi:hypothetical protein